MNEELQENLTKTQAKLKYATTSQVKEMEKLLVQRDNQVNMLKQMLKSNEIQIRTKNKDINHLKNKVKLNESRNIIRSVESLPFINDVASKKGKYDYYMNSVASGMKTHRYEMIRFYAFRTNKLVLSPNVGQKKESEIFERKIISRSSLRSPQGSV